MYAQLIAMNIKVAFEAAAEAENFKTAANMINESREYLAEMEQGTEEYAKCELTIVRMEETIADLEKHKGDWFAQYYACSAGASSISDVKANRHRTIKVK